MNDLTPEQRERAVELYRLYHYLRSGCESEVTGVSGMMPRTVSAWLAMEDHILASHTCPDPGDDSRVKAWLAIAVHPFFADCYSAEGTLVDAVLAKLDATHTHTCGPVWRPTTADEIRPGWEVRSRRRNGMEGRWGVAHTRDADGDWRTERGRMLTWDDMSWTYETTAPATEPKPDPRVAVVVDWSNEPASSTRDGAARELLARLDALTEGEQS